MLYTSNFSNYEELKHRKIIPISIAGKAPVWFHDTEFKWLAPKWFFFDLYKKKTIDKEDYTHFYNKYVLNRLTEIQIHDIFELSESEKHYAFLCYEQSNEFCHRFLISEFLSRRWKIQIDELNYKL